MNVQRGTCIGCEFLERRLNAWTHVTIGLFETFETLGQALATSLQDLLEQYDLTKKILAYVKDEGANMNTMTTNLKSIVSCKTLGVILENFHGTCCNWWWWFWLNYWVGNMRKNIIGVIKFFLSWKKYDERKIHDMQALMLDLKFKSLKLIFSFICCEHEVAIIEKYDRKSLFFMLFFIIICIHCLKLKISLFT